MTYTYNNDISYPFRLPVTKFSTNSFDSSKLDNNDSFSNDSYFDASFIVGQETYCEILSSLDNACWESNLASLWEYNDSVIRNLTLEDILLKINSKTVRYFITLSNSYIVLI